LNYVNDPSKLHSLFSNVLACSVQFQTSLLPLTNGESSSHERRLMAKLIVALTSGQSASCIKFGNANQNTRSQALVGQRIQLNLSATTSAKYNTETFLWFPPVCVIPNEVSVTAISSLLVALHSSTNRESG